MSKRPSIKKLLIPALKAQMGDWNYYIAFLRFADVSQRISIVEEIHSAKSLRELLQRGLKNRAPEIADYLQTQPQRFFNALVVGTYGGHPQWQELEIGQSRISNTKAPLYAEGSLGFLSLSGKEILFAIDGQHRVAGIREAIVQNPALKDEEVAVIFLRGVTQKQRKEDRLGFERTRRLFTTLNSRAKPVGKRDIIALDEDDVVAITTRELVEEHPLFQNKIYAKGSRSIAPNNKVALTTIIALYDSLDVFLRASIQGLPFGKQRRPSEVQIKKIMDLTKSLYAILVRYFKPFAEVEDSAPSDEVAGSYRSRNGGHFLFRPIGFIILHRVITRLVDAGIELETAVKRISRVPMMLDAAPWQGLVWDSGNKRMVTTKENQRVAERLLFHSIGGDVAVYKTSPRALADEWAGALNKDPSEVDLPTYYRVKLKDV